MRKNIVFTLFAVLIFSLSALAEDIRADKVVVSTPKYKPELSEFKPDLGTYQYNVFWSRIPAATVYFTVEKDGLNYTLSTKVKTVKAVDLFYKLRYEAKGKISAVNYHPINAYLKQKENSRVKEASIEFLPSGEIKSIFLKKGKEPQELQFKPNNYMLDPFSAGFVARSLDWKEGQSRYFDTFNGKSRYLISFTALEKTNMRINGEKRDVWVIEPKVKKLTTTDTKSKLREAKIYITADEKREIVKIDSEVFIGTVKTKLKSFVPSEQPEYTTVAVRRKHKIEYVF